MSLARVRGPGQPDQICDAVAGAIAEEYARRDAGARMDIRVSGGHGVLFVAGEVASSADFDVSAVVRRVLGASGLTAPTEPFIALETMVAGQALSSGGRDDWSVVGYATTETPALLPRSVALVRDVARELERRRTGDVDWFWLGSDYVVSVEEKGAISVVTIRAEHVASYSVVQVRETVQRVFADRLTNVELRVNPAGEESGVGLAHRVGSSGQSGSADGYGLRLPWHGSGAGRHLRHPLNAGAWLARAAARQLIANGQSKAVVVRVSWAPLEERPSQIQARNEKGVDLSSGLSFAQFDLTKIPDEYSTPSLLTTALRLGFDGSIHVPWEM